MRKTVIIILLLLSIVLFVLGKKLSNQSITQVFSNWRLVRSVKAIDFYGNPHDYKLVTQGDPYSLTLKDKKGNVLWTKTNLQRYSNMIIIDDSNLSGDIDVQDISYEEATNSPQDRDTDDYIDWEGYFPDNWIASMGYELTDGKGNCLVTDRNDHSFVWVDKKGKEMYLPMKSDDWTYVGMALDKYVVFTIRVDSEQNKQCAIYNKQGTKLKQFDLPAYDDTWAEGVYIDDNAEFLVYNRSSDEEGYTLISTGGQIIETPNLTSSVIRVYEPVFSPDSKLWIPQIFDKDEFTILDIKTGEIVYTLKDTYNCQAAISNRKAGRMIVTNRTGVRVLDYKHNKTLFHKTNDKAEFTEPWISGDGKEIRFIYQEKGKHAKMRYYRKW